MRILLATDGSEFADEAAAQCGELASDIERALVKIVTVADYTVDVASKPFSSSTEFMKAVEDGMEKRSAEIIAKTKAIVSYENPKIDIETEVFVGEAKTLILAEAEKWNADLIVVGSHGYGTFTRTLLGSVSDAILHRAKCSVLIAKRRNS